MSMIDEIEKEFSFALNRMELAAQSNAPAANGYGEHRKEVLGRIAALVEYLKAAEEQFENGEMPLRFSLAKRLEAARAKLGLK